MPTQLSAIESFATHGLDGIPENRVDLSNFYRHSFRGLPSGAVKRSSTGVARWRRFEKDGNGFFILARPVCYPRGTTQDSPVRPWVVDRDLPQPRHLADSSYKR